MGVNGGMEDRLHRLVTTQTLIGSLAFGMVSHSGGVTALAVLLILTSRIRIVRRRFRLTGWAVLCLALVAVVWLPWEVRLRGGDLVVPIAHFTIALQILLLLGHRSHREDAQILVLSLLHMVAATIMARHGPLLIFLSLLTVYSINGLVTLVTFHLLLAEEAVRRASRMQVPVGSALPPSIYSAMQQRRLNLLVLATGAICAATAACVYVLVPRNTSPANHHRLLSHHAARRPGFATSMNLRDAGPLGNDRSVVMTIDYRGPMFDDADTSRLMRGTTLDVYDGRTGTWRRSADRLTAYRILSMHGAPVPLGRPPQNTPLASATIRLVAPYDHQLFAFYLPATIASSDLSDVRISTRDQRLESTHPMHPNVRYTLQWAPVEMGVPPATQSSPRPAGPADGHDPKHHPWPDQQRMIADLAWRIVGRQGVNAAELPNRDARTAAVALRAHLRGYRYALTNPAVERGTDPVAAFLLEHKQGHCELFASGLAAMAHAVGLRARVALGFRVSEYNRFADGFIVRRDHAHAWTEIFCGEEGWIPFDATPPADLADEHADDDGFVRWCSDLYEYVELAWLRPVIAYEHQRKHDETSAPNGTSTPPSRTPGTWIKDHYAAAVTYLKSRDIDLWGLGFIALVTCFILLGLGTLTRIVLIRKRRFAALQLTRLPRHRRRQLAGRLKFYLIMLDKLERRGHVRPVWQSPFGFAEALTAANEVRFAPVVALTEIFYEIRFGYRDLDDARQDEVRTHLRQLDTALSRRS